MTATQYDTTTMPPHDPPHTMPCHDANARCDNANKTTTTAGCTKVRPFFYFLFYSTNKNLTTLTIPLLPEHDKHKKHTQTGASTGSMYKVHLLFFIFYFNSNNLVNLPPAPTTHENERDGSFSGGGGMTFPGNHHLPQPPKMSPSARFQ